jgi:PAS domain S-box-containing protein
MPSSLPADPTEERFRALVEAVEDYAILMLAPSGHVMTWNTGAQRMTGYSAEETVGRHFSDFYLLDRLAAHEADLALYSARADGRFESEGWGTRRDGMAFRIHFVATVVVDSANVPRGFALAVRELMARTCVMLKSGRAGRLAARIQAAREDEQARIARELHDDLGQQLTALSMAVERLDLDLSDSGTAPGQLATDTQDLRRLVDGTIVSLRRIAAGLRPIMLETLGLVPALEWLIEDFMRRYGIAVEARLRANDIDSADAIAAALFHIVQEALTNVARHANARRVVIELKCDEQHCLLRIDDDGQGASAEKLISNETSFGLIGMRERVDRLGGTMLIESATGRGLRIAIAIPVERMQRGS